jgi:K+-sensing histidine kinase KdpD
MLAVVAGIALRQAMTPVLGFGFPFITVFPAVFVAAYLGGLGPALLATLLSVLAALYLFIEPGIAMVWGDSAAQIGAAIFVVSGLLTGWLGESRLRAHRRVSAAVARVVEVGANPIPS